VSLLVKQNDVNLDALDSSKSTPLHYAAASAHEESVRLLLEARADITPRNAMSQTAEEAALAAKHLLLAQLLVAARRRGRQFVAPDLSDRPLARHAMFALPLLLLTGVSGSLARHGWLSWQTFVVLTVALLTTARVQKVRSPTTTVVAAAAPPNIFCSIYIVYVARS
jgi:ankyrin repeat protein